MIERGGGINVFEYTDFRKFCADYFEYKKSINKHFSHRLFAKKAGIKSYGYFSEVVSGARKLSKNMVGRFAQGFEFDEKERDFFGILTAFGQAKTNAAKKVLYQRLIDALPAKIQELKRSQMDYFSQWYFVAVREALSIRKVKDEYRELAATLSPNISQAQAKGAIRQLALLELIERDAEGNWRPRHSTVLPIKDESSDVLVRSFQAEMMNKALHALETVPPAHRDISTITISISRDGMERLKNAVEEFRMQVRKIARSDQGEDRIAQVNIQVFPLTQFAAIQGGGHDE